MKIALLRLQNQQISQHRFLFPSEVVSELGAIQAQDFSGAKWSIGLRLNKAIEADVERAIAEKRIIRTWPMRGTLHFVAAADVHWMRALLTPRILAGSIQRQNNLELTAAVFARCEKIFLKALRGGKQLSREAMSVLLEKEGISATGPRSYHIFWRLAQEGLLCFGAHEGKQSTFTLLDEWAPAGKSRSRDESLAELATRYFTGHGPATLQDFVWWSGLKVSEARAGIDLATSALEHEVFEGKTYWVSRAMPALASKLDPVFLLPGFDEYMLGYKDRGASLDPRHAPKLCPGSNGIFTPTVVIHGRVVGTWKRVIKKGVVSITPTPFKSFSRADKEAIEIVAKRYCKFGGNATE